VLRWYHTIHRILLLLQPMLLLLLLLPMLLPLLLLLLLLSLLECLNGLSVRQHPVLRGYHTIQQSIPIWLSRAACLHPPSFEGLNIGIIHTVWGRGGAGQRVSSVTNECAGGGGGWGA
jgi:hypothetical protein